MGRRKNGKGLPLAPSWMPLIAERVAQDAALIAAAARQYGIFGLSDDYEWIARGLPEAQLWWVTRDMAMLAVDTAEDEEGFDETIEAHVPADRGFIIWGGGLPIMIDQPPAVYRGSVRVDALYWEMIDGKLYYQLFSADCGLLDAVSHWACRSPLAMAQEPRIRDGEQRYLMRVLAATWALAGQPSIAATSDASWDPKQGPCPRALDKATRRRDTQVMLVYLRENQPTGAGDATQRGREYSCRWIVRGFYRQQPCGPGRSQRRIQWIPPHVAGPADKPLKSKPVVHVWNRPPIPPGG